MVLDRAKMIKALHANEQKRIAEMNVALAKTRNEWERRQCFDAYCNLMNQEWDRIAQSHGAPARVWYMPELIDKNGTTQENER